MTDDFKKVLAFLFKWENVYDKEGNVISEMDPDDRGGLTKFGIDQRSHPEVDVANLTQEQAVEIYWSEWLDCSASKLPSPLSIVYFDAVVNTGKTQATLFLQRVCGTKDDGIFGPKTLASVLKTIENSSVERVAKVFCDARRAFYKKLAHQNSKCRKFEGGWNNRVSGIEELIT